MATLEAHIKFDSFHQENPRVYQLFKQFAFQLIGAGRTRIGARLIGERIRWETALSTNGQDFKLNDHYWPFYARKFVEENPKYTPVFEFRHRHEE